MCIICEGNYLDKYIINCTGCKKLKFIPPLPNVRMLICPQCINLRGISRDCPNLTELNLRGCESIIYIPRFQYLERLYCDYCTSLKTVESSPGLKFIICSYSGIIDLLLESSVRYLYANGCKSLLSVRAPSIYAIAYSSCPCLVSVSGNVSVYMNNINTPWVENNNNEYVDNVRLMMESLEEYMVLDLAKIVSEYMLGSV